MYLLLCLGGGTYCLPQMIASAKETFLFTILVLLVLLPFLSSYTQGKAAMGGADQPQGDMMKLISRIPSSSTAQEQPKESVAIYRVPSSFELAHGSFLILENPVVSMPILKVIYSQTNNSLFLEV